jgi:hypothetical protein
MDSIKKLTDDRFYTAWFVLVVMLGSALGSWFGTVTTVNFDANITGGDAIAIANTYIMWVSVVFILMTLALTILGFWATKKFSEDRAKEVHQTIVVIGSELRENDVTRKLFIEELMKNEDIIDEIKTKIDEIKQTAIDEIKDEANKHAIGGKDRIEGVSL